MALTIYDADGNGASPGVRAVVQPELGPTTAENLPSGYFSAWYYYPQFVENTWWLVFQWKQEVAGSNNSLTHKLLYFVLLDDHPDGTMTYRLRTAVDASGNHTTNHFTLQESTLPVPIGKWTHLECYYGWSKAADGTIACWQDGVKIFDRSGLHTELDMPYKYRPRVWTLNNYASHTAPATHTIYVDDAAISRTRRGPSAGF